MLDLRTYYVTGSFWRPVDSKLFFQENKKSNISLHVRFRLAFVLSIQANFLLVDIINLNWAHLFLTVTKLMLWARRFFENFIFRFQDPANTPSLSVQFLRAVESFVIRVAITKKSNKWLTKQTFLSVTVENKWYDSYDQNCLLPNSELKTCIWITRMGSVVFIQDPHRKHT